MSFKTHDPKIIALYDAQQKAWADYQRWYSRMRRAVAKLEKARQKCQRLDNRIKKLAQTQEE